MRELSWHGGRNLRDLGGLATPLSPAGATFHGRIARGPRRELLSQRGWIDASAWGLRSIVDLRSADEVGRREGDPHAIPPRSASITLAPTEDQSDPQFRAVCMPILDSPEYWRHNVRILPASMRRSLEVISTGEPGILVHCGAGRDRTGMISAILLANAGVSSSDIFEDYAASVRAMAGTGPQAHAASDRQASWTPAQVSRWLREVEPIVRAFADGVEDILDQLEVGDATRAELRGLLTRRLVRWPGQPAT